MKYICKTSHYIVLHTELDCHIINQTAQIVLNKKRNFSFSTSCHEGKCNDTIAPTFIYSWLGGPCYPDFASACMSVNRFAFNGREFQARSWISLTCYAIQYY